MKLHPLAAGGITLIKKNKCWHLANTLLYRCQKPGNCGMRRGNRSKLANTPHAKRKPRGFAARMKVKTPARCWMELKGKGLQEKYHKQCLIRMEQYVFPMIGALPITEIIIPDVVRVVEKIGKRGTIETAKKMKQLMGQVFRYASQRGICQHNPAADLRDVLPSVEEKHHACISFDELPKLLQAIDSRENNMSKTAMQLLALIFVRTSELIGAKWEEIDWNREEGHIPKERMKMNRPYMVPLSRQTLAILKGLQVLIPISLQ